MNVFTGYLVSAILGMTLAVTIVLFLRKALYQLLVELCGNGARAQYWSIFSGLFLVLCTLYGVMGLLPAVSGVAIVLVLVIHRRENQLAQKPSSAMH